MNVFSDVIRTNSMIEYNDKKSLKMLETLFNLKHSVIIFKNSVKIALKFSKIPFYF